MTDDPVQPDPVPAPDALEPTAPVEVPPPSEAATPATPPAVEPATAAAATAVVASAPKASRKRRATGTVGRVVGVIGVVISLLLVVGVIVGRGWVVTQVSDISATLDNAVAKAVPYVDGAQDKVDKAATIAGEVAAVAESVAQDPNATPTALQGIVEKLNGVSQRYLELRQGYNGLREKLVSALDRLQMVDRFIPGFDLPQGPIDALNSLDEKAQALDTQVMGLIQAGQSLNAIDKAAAAIGEKARQAETGLQAVSTGLDDIETKLADVQAQIDDTTATVNTAITVLAIVFVLLFLYIAFLHVVLFRSSGGYARAPSA